MSDKPSLRKESRDSTTPAGPTVSPPRYIVIATGALIVSGVMAVLAGLALLTGTLKSWIRDNARDTFTDDMLDKLKDARKAGPSSGTRGTQLDQLQTQLRDLKQTAADRLTAKLQPLYDSVAQLKPGASAKGKGLFDDIHDRLDDVKNIGDQITAAQKGTLISSIVVLIALGIAAGAVYRGRFWSRWAVLGLWVLGTFTGSVAGVGSVLGIAGNVPAIYKVPTFLSGLALVVAVVLVNLRPSVAFLNRGRPVRPGSATAQRRSFFSPRTPVVPGSTAPAARAPRTDTADRARTKQRATSDAAAAAKGAELARKRAKAANKSRRSGT